MPASNIFFAIWLAFKFLPSSHPFSKAVSIEFLTSRYAYKLSSYSFNSVGVNFE